MWSLRFHKNFVFRTPAYSFSESVLNPTTVKKFVSEEKFQKAIYVSSIVLFNEIQRWLKGELKNEKDLKRLLYSVSKYISRIQTRCTPYGLFAACSTGEWGAESDIKITGDLRSHTRLDMDFVCALTQYLSENPIFQPYILFYPNNSIYPIGDELRYVEYKLIKELRSHTLKTVSKSDYITGVLNAAKPGAHLNSLIELLVKQGIKFEDAKSFINEMVKAQLLVSELEPAVTGEEFMSPLLKTLQRIYRQSNDKELGNIVNYISEIKGQTELLDAESGQNIQGYKELIKTIKQVKIPISEKVFIQVDAYRQSSKAALNETIQQNLIKVIGFLKKMSLPFQAGDLTNFKNRFYEKYEEREMPLLEVLDKEIGIGYPFKDNDGVNPLIDDFIVPQQQNVGMQIGSNNKDQMLYEKLTEALKHNNTVVTFKDKDLEGFTGHENGISPITLSVMFKLIDAKSNKIQLSFLGGNPSAASLLGRFAHGDKEILNIIRDIVEYENEVMQGKILAEIVHLPQSRIGNIILRPTLRDYEIPYLGKSGLPTECQISLSDLKVSVKNNRVILRSERLNKEILPRMSTAHNYSMNALPVYKFLCDMQIQDVNMPGLFFNWGGQSKSFKFLPRAEYNDVILMPATWNLSKQDYDNLLKNINSDSFSKEVKDWKLKWKLPRYIMLKEGDNELFIDLESELSVKTFLDSVKKRNEIELVEFLFNAESALVHDEKGYPYTNEIITILFNDDYKGKTSDLTLYNNIGKIAKKPDEIAKRFFPPGSEWLFYKIYCGVASADKILLNVIRPLVEDLRRKRLIERWFFIRYSDPDFHIRLRLYNRDINKIGEIIQVLNPYLNQLQEKHHVTKIMNDTYNRELERYGNNTIEITEEYFEIESEMALNLINIATGENWEDIKLFYAFRSIDELLDNFYFTPGQKLHFMEILKGNFIREHGGSKELKLSLDDKFREHRKKLEGVLGKKNDNEVDYISIANLLNWRKLKISSIADSIVKLHEKRQLQPSLYNRPLA